MKKLLIIALLLGAAVVVWTTLRPVTPTVDFNTQVKPILNKRCISCHGGVKREADFSLLFPQEALAPTESGKPAIIPGDAAHSELIRRITSHDEEERMPYKKEPLTKQEIDVLTAWIDQGAPWGNHWAYEPVQQRVPPQRPEWGSNEVDAWIAEKQEEVGLQPSTPASDEVLLRRVALDLIGLPAPAPWQQLFLNKQLTYEALVDSLLASPHYGERWAAVWLDLARYADTKGYERDDSRNIWRYRDWLIRAFNRDMPYDSFLIEQLAGDLLPNPTDEQYLATGFHRNTMTNDEGGTENEEYRTAAVLDRVNTTWEALMGTTFACVQCHSHPYDPFRHEEYYRFAAFFNNSRDEDTYDDYPLLRHFDPADEAQLQKIREWVGTHASPQKATQVYQFAKLWQPTINSIQADQFVNSELTDTKWLIFRNNALCRLPRVTLTEAKHMWVRYASYRPGGRWTIHLDSPNGPVLTTVPVPDTKGGWKIESFSIQPPAGVHHLYFTYTNPQLKKPEDSGMIFDWFYFTDYQIPEPTMHEAFEQLLRKDVDGTPVMMENPASLSRATQVFERGNWLVKGDTVTPNVPASLPPLPPGAAANRLGLAQWMVSPTHPLTSRTVVNRVWEQIFGMGLVETLEDMGTQGVPPTHPELLDHLSHRLMHEYRWSLKTLIRTIVLSATYRQDSKVTPEQLAADPQNRYYARAPRVRLSAEQVRDQALAVSGLLSRKMYGPSVMPYQPDGIWLSPWNGATWVKSAGEDQHRRGLYTYWKRTAPYPSMMTFDGTAREVCTARRIKTNTPLQALVMLNDSVYVEAAQQLAVQMQRVPGPLEEQVKAGFRQALGRTPSPETIQTLVKLFQQTTANPEMKPVQQSKQSSEQPKSTQQKAYFLVATTLLNLDEFVTKN